MMRTPAAPFLARLPRTFRGIVIGERDRRQVNRAGAARHSCGSHAPSEPSNDNAGQCAA